MAAAYVSGAAALLRAAHPADTPAQIISRLLQAVDSRPNFSGKCASAGRLNLRKALAVPVSTPMLKASLAPPNGPIRLLLSGDPGRTYVLEASTNLWEWSPDSTNLADLTGSLVVTNAFSADAPRVFYRARLAP